VPVENDLRLTQEYAEKLFVHAYVDLGQRSEIRDDFRLYHQLNMARLLRQLLTGSTALLNCANRYHRLPIRFVVARLGPAPTGLGKIPAIYEESKPCLVDFPPGYFLHPFTLDGFLASSPLALAGRSFSVLEIVKYVANDFGGVHLSQYLEDKDDQLLARFNDHSKVAGDGMVLHCIDQISRTTLVALAPLVRAIEAKYNNDE